MSRATCVAAALFGTALAHASVFYRFDVVAETGTAPFSFTSLGNGPSINAKGKVAYVGRVTQNSNESVIVRSPVGPTPTDIWPASHLQNRTFGETVRINGNDEVAVWTHTFAPQNTYEVRVFRSATVNDNSVMVRGNSPSPPYDLLYQNPWINDTQSLEDTSSFIAGGDKDGVCDAGETCVSQTVYNAFRSTPARYLGTVVKNPSDAADPGVQHETGLDTRQSRPMMTDDGRIVVRGNLSSNPILLYNYALGSPTTIAGSGQGFTSLGLAPGITPDGKVIAFAGARGHGAGIFLSIEQSPSVRRLVRIVGENADVQKAELGVNGSNQKLYFSQIVLDSRVGIAYTPDQLGNANKSVVVSFVGTPNGPSRDNPGTGKSFLFSGQKGLWTIRVDLEAELFNNVCVIRSPGVTSNSLVASGDDQIVTPPGLPPYISAGADGACQSENAHDTETLFSRSSPIPVVQVGDTIHSPTGNHTVADVGVHDPIAPANYDGSLVARAARVGDHRVAFWASIDGGANQMIVAGDHLDSDQDGLLDHWETTGIDLDGTGAIDLDLAAMGADPFVRDFFFQLDWAIDRANDPVSIRGKHAPAPGVLRKVEQFYAGAPALPNGIPAGIRIHVDAGTGLDASGQPWSRNMGSGPLRGGNVVNAPGNQPIDILYFGTPNSVNIPGVTAVSFDTIKNSVFWNHHRGAREFAFMHIVIADFHHAVGMSGGTDNVNPIVGTGTSGSSSFTLQDASTANFSSHQLGGHAVKITAGTGAGQMRTISASYVNLFPGSGGYVQINDPWTTIPDTTSQYIILHGSAGEGWAGRRPDGAFSPGRNLVITLAGYGRIPPGNFIGSFTDQWKTYAHEVGHLTSLMHGGTNHDNYKTFYVSLMNYAYENCVAPNIGSDASGNPLPFGALCPIDRYSLLVDLVSDNWKHVDLRFSHNFQRFGQAFGASPEPPNSPFVDEPKGRTVAEILIQNKTRDIQGPVVQIGAPVGGGVVTPGSTIPVGFTATDNGSVANAEVGFDVNGDGSIDGASEVFAAVHGAGNSYTATIPAVSGPSGSRRVSVVAYDDGGNSGAAFVVVNVGTVANVAIPNVVGQGEEAAINSIEAAVFGVGTVTRAQSPSVPAGAVISQNPAGGQLRAPGTPVNLVVSLGATGAVVPNVVGLSLAAASGAISAAGFIVGNVILDGSGTGPASTVLGQAPLASTAAPSGSAIDLLVSAPPGGVTVPNVVGLTQAAAQSAITGAGLVVGTVTNAPSETVPAGSVISQNPAAGASVASGSTVDIVVSTGPPPPAQRTFVSPLGNDGNLCTVTAPCRSFSRAIARTASGGEVIVLASAGYGSATITKPISIVAVQGIYAGVSVTTGAGIVVNPGSGRVTLVGLSINGLGGAIGVDYQSGDALYIDDCLIVGFSQAGIRAQGSATGALYVRRTTLRDNTTGIAAGLAAAALLHIDVDRTQVERNAIGMVVDGHGAVGTLRNGGFSENGTALSIAPNAAGASARFEVRKISFSANGAGLIVGGTAGTTARAVVVKSMVAGSAGVGVSTAVGGTTWISDTTITRNATGLQQTGGGASVSFMNNRLFGNTSDGAFSSSLAPQ